MSVWILIILTIAILTYITYKEIEMKKQNDEDWQSVQMYIDVCAIWIGCVGMIAMLSNYLDMPFI